MGQGNIPPSREAALPVPSFCVTEALHGNTHLPEFCESLFNLILSYKFSALAAPLSILLWLRMWPHPVVFGVNSYYSLTSCTFGGQFFTF